MKYLMTLCSIITVLLGGWAGFEGEWFLIIVAFCALIGFVFAEMVFDGQEYVDGYDPDRIKI